MENNLGSAIASGSKELASGILFSKCVAASPVYYTVFVDAASHVFEDCKFYGTVLVWHQGKSEKDGTTFRRCQFEDIYRDKKMYDGGYQLGAEAKAVQVDSCTFRAYHTTSYYLAAHTKDCSPSNPEKIKVSNSSFYNYAKEGLKISPGIAGMAGFTAFYNNRFYALKGTRFQNGFEQNCNADAGKNQFYEAIKK